MNIPLAIRKGVKIREEHPHNYKTKLYAIGVSYCNHCEQVLFLSDFYRRNKYRWPCLEYDGTCKRCRIKIDKERRPFRHSKSMADRTAPERVAFRAKKRKDYRKAREKALGGYGGKCACCGEDTYEFLAFDHVNNDGNEHRKQVNTASIVWWVIKNDWPDTLQVLCHNCNMAKARHGVCPHQKQLV